MRRAPARCALTRDIAFGPAPAGFWPDGGWCVNRKGQKNGIRAVQGRWTRELTEAQVGRASEVTNGVLPSGVAAISGDAFLDYAALRSLTIQPGCVTIEDWAGQWSGLAEDEGGAMARCSALVTVTIPDTCRGDGDSVARPRTAEVWTAMVSSPGESLRTTRA
jgi:hypothetical protein